MITGLGIFFLNTLNAIKAQVQISNIQELQTKTVWMVGIMNGLLAILGIAMAGILSKYVIYPINRFIKSAETMPKDDKNRRN